MPASREPIWLQCTARPAPEQWATQQARSHQLLEEFRAQAVRHAPWHRAWACRCWMISRAQLKSHIQVWAPAVEAKVKQIGIGGLVMETSREEVRADKSCWNWHCEIRHGHSLALSGLGPQSAY